MPTQPPAATRMAHALLLHHASPAAPSATCSQECRTHAPGTERTLACYAGYGEPALRMHAIHAQGAARKASKGVSYLGCPAAFMSFILENTCYTIGQAG